MEEKIKRYKEQIESILTDIGCEPTLAEDGGINCKFERENFIIDVKEGIIEFWDLYWYNIDANHSDMNKLLDAINLANHINLPVIFTPSATEEGQRWFSSVYKLIGEEVIITKELITDILSSFFKLKKDFTTILQSLIQKSHQIEEDKEETPDRKDGKKENWIILNEVEFSNNKKEELDFLKEKNKKLFCSALKSLGCFLREDQDGNVWMEYEGDTFLFKFQPREVEINDLDWKIINVNDDDFPDIMYAIRFANHYTIPSIWASAPYPDGTIKISSVYRFYNFENEDYVNMVGAIMQSFFHAKQRFHYILQDWKVNKDQILERIPKGRELEFDFEINKVKEENKETDSGDYEESFQEGTAKENENSEKGPDGIEKQKGVFNSILLHLGCQPSYENLESEEPLKFKYQGLEFLVTFDPDCAYIYTIGWEAAPYSPQTALDFNSIINTLYIENPFTPKIMVRYSEEHNLLYTTPQYIIPFPVEEELMMASMGIIFRMTKEMLDSIVETRLHFINKMKQIFQQRADQDQSANN